MRFASPQFRRPNRSGRPAGKMSRQLKILNIGVHGNEYRSKDFSNFRHFPSKPPLNGVKME